MASTGDLVSIKMIVDRLMQNPLMKDLNFEFIVDKTIEVLELVDVPAIYTSGREVLNVENYRALKPALMSSITAIVRTDQSLDVPLVASSDVAQEYFYTGDKLPSRTDNTYTLNSKYINLNFESGTVIIYYKMLAIDEECYPLIVNNASLLRCIESYIKYRWFDILNDMDIVSDRKLAKAEQDYMFNVGQAESDLKMPSEAEMEQFTNLVTQMIPSRTEFLSRFEFLGQQEFLRIQ